MTILEAPSPGLRVRQKNKRHAFILDCAKVLLEEQGYDATTMAKIAEAADVSTPTVFNYFGSKDELIIEMVLAGHEVGQKVIASWQPGSELTFGQLLTEMMCLYTDLTMSICDKRVWRFAEATNIRRPESDVVAMYSRIETNHVSDIAQILANHTPVSAAFSESQCGFMARIIYNHWNALFLNFIRDELMTLSDFKQAITDDMQQLADLLGRSGEV